MFFERLKKACFDKKISVSRLLRELGFSTSNVTYWRKGSIPKIDRLIKISEYLDIPVEYLIEGGVHGVPYSSGGAERSSIDSSEPGRPVKAHSVPDSSYGTEKSSTTDRQLGRLEGRIEELEKKNTEYKETIDNLAEQLRNTMEKMTEQVEKMSKQLNNLGQSPAP